MRSRQIRSFQFPWYIGEMIHDQYLKPPPSLATHSLHPPLVQNTISYHIIENKSQIMGVSLTVIMNQHVDLQKISSHPRVFMT